MNLEKAIIVRNVSKKYKLYNSTKDRLLDLFSMRSRGESFYALRDVNFEAEKGVVVGFVGINGSGKSTLSNIIAGIVPQTSGTVTVNGEVSLIAVSAGLKNELTGRDNIELKLLMLGFSKEQIKELEDEIIEFSELGKFIDQPVKSYSSGMKSRLGFSISVNVDPDILIIDEALSVGDKAFAEKSLNKMLEFKEKGKTMIFVSHSLSQMRQFCDKILWLEFGRVKAYGEVDDILIQYQEFLNMWKQLSKEERAEYREKAMAGTLNYDKYLNKIERVHEKNYSERFVSKVVRIRKKESFVYDSPTDSRPSESLDKYKESSYYAKKEAEIDDEIYYLLSSKPSAIHGVIGWVKEKDLKTRNLLNIDEDYKEFIVTGTGSAYDIPWGQKKNIVIVDLSKYKDEIFFVERTDKLGKQIWYYGSLKDKKVWIHEKHLMSVNKLY